ncbi:hypothetical protein BDW69DRAFT_190588 [Aspergillus filifer]
MYNHHVRLEAILKRAGLMELAVSRLEIADIESLDIAKDIWGADALKLDPERCNHISDLQKKEFMPFGNKPFLCPAKPVFAPMAVGLIVGALLAALEGDNWDIQCHDSHVLEGFNRCDRLSLRRDSYTDIVLRWHSD